MNTIIVMNVTGTCAWFGYLLLRKVMKDRISERLKYILLRINVLLFVVPLHFLGQAYQTVAIELFSYRQERNQFRPKDMILLETDTGKYVASLGLRIEMLLVAAYVFLAILMIGYWLIRDKRFQKDISQMACLGKKQEDPLLDELIEKYHIRTKIDHYAAKENVVAITIGIMKPLMLYKIPEGKTEHEMLLSHELYHIKRHDILWRVLGNLAKGLNFWNPFVYLLCRELEKVCELSCDEWVIGDREISFRAAYAKLLVEYSGFSLSKKAPAATPLGVKKMHGKSNLEERVVFVMEHDRKKKIRTAAGGILAVGMLFLCSLTTFAYKNVYEMEMNEMEATLWAKGEKVERIDTRVGEELPFQDDLVFYPVQYTDSQGNIYPLKEIGDTAQINAICLFHTYEDVTVTYHTVKANGSCNVRVYSAKKCTKCGKLKDEVLLRETTNNPCPH